MPEDTQLSLFGAELDPPHVMVVDDDAMVRAALSHTLRDAGYTVTEAESGFAALELWAAGADAYDLLVTDVQMAGMLGTRLAREFWSVRPGFPIIFASGDYSFAVLGRDPNGCAAFLEKPFDPDQLLARVRGLLHEARPAQMV